MSPFSATSRRPDEQEVDRGRPHYGPAVLIYRLDHGIDDSAIRFAQRSARLDDRGPNTERIARTHRIGPADLIEARAAEARLRGQVIVDEQPHHESGGMPAACDQPAERSGGRGQRIDVKRLRIELFSESYDASFVNADASALLGHAERIV